MTQDQVMGLLRQLSPMIGSMLLTFGFTGLAGLWAQVSGAVIVIIGGIWAYVANSKKSIITSATNMPEVDSKKLAAAIVDPELKAAANNPTPVVVNEVKK